MRVAVLDDYQRVAHRCADWSGLDVDFVHEHLAPEALRDRLSGVEVVVAMRERTAFGAAEFAGLPDLRLLVTTGTANAAIDLDAARGHGVVVCGTRMVGNPTAELTFGLLLALVRRIPAEDAALRAGRWQTGLGLTLEGLTFGTIGLGRLGAKVAGIAQAFGMRVLAWSQHLDPAHARDLGVDPVGKDDLLRRSDVVSIHTRLSERTRGLIGARELALCKPTAFLLNTSRGPIVDTDALVAALHAGTIAGAGLDVFDVEPLPAGHPLRSAPRTVLTPHLGYVTEPSYERMYADAVEDVTAWAAGDPVRVLT
ncbi:D-2-hydroxyacid dehydrogenase family protein [Kineococcus rhizosphaerae]|uniref:Phosphoglycerate dehydrogenase-like enzyme n=1 Tax=Kineococcus rhizosphaerae TaxID=559628 RepID=A0A2T0R7E2_9ACTN|nr:D-2-hydroxyacid dehydrogenase family protein [Kineococcus rhizosphaerae]PRY17072.1 phosphoglycerate dehydrogenase-like enzyme [Kineococcus rhizosphaerae]